jgi:hypothetical protein
MIQEITKIEVQAIIQIAKWISLLISTGAALSATVFIMRLTRHETFRLGQLEFPLSKFVFVAIAFTIGHAFLTWMFVQRVSSVIPLGVDITHLAWRMLTSSDAFIFNNMKPRTVVQGEWPFKGGYKAEGNDTAFWLTFFFSVAVIGAISSTMLPCKKTKPPSSKNRKYKNKIKVAERSSNVDIADVSLYICWLGKLGLASAISGANWVIGSQWAIWASALAK